jgi:hypothetical protein
MADLKLERLLIEAVGNLLDNLGFVDNGVEQTNHNVQFQWEEINDKFAIKVKDSDFFENLTSTFRKIHSYKWIVDPMLHKDHDGNNTGGDHQSSFLDAFTSDLISQGVPKKDIEIGLKAIGSLQKEYGKENDVGYPSNLGNIKDMINNPKNKPVSDTKKETMSGDNEPFSGAEPKNVRPVPSKA